jgi:hypothetical protein
LADGRFDATLFLVALALGLTRLLADGRFDATLFLVALALGLTRLLADGRFDATLFLVALAFEAGLLLVALAFEEGLLLVALAFEAGRFLVALPFEAGRFLVALALEVLFLFFTDVFPISISPTKINDCPLNLFFDYSSNTTPRIMKQRWLLSAHQLRCITSFFPLFSFCYK